MRILFLTTHINTGGITSYLYNLSKGLIRDGQEVRIGSSGGEKAGDFGRIGVELLNLDIGTKSEANPKIYWSCLRLADFIKRNQIDIIHAHTRITQVMGAFLSKLTAKPYVTTCHGFFKPRLFRRILPCWGIKVIAISPAVQEHLVKDFQVARDRIRLIKTGIDIEDFASATTEQKQQMKQSVQIPPGPVIGIIARLSQEKSHGLLIEAMGKVTQKIPDARLLIVGTGRLEKELKEQVQENNMSEHVLFFPTVNRTADFLALCDVFVMPSRQEGLGLSVMEAQAAGLPVIVTKVGGLPSLVEHDQTGLLINPDNKEELARAIIYMFLHRDDARRMGRNAREFIKNECSYVGMSQQTLSLYQEMIKEGVQGSDYKG